MTVIHRSAASLGFFGDDLEPEEISAALGAVPTVGVKKGGIWHTSMGAEKVALRGRWSLQTTRREPGDLEGQIVELLAACGDNLAAWRLLANRYRGRIFCGLFLATANEMLSLSPEILTAVAQRGLILDFDIYGSEMAD